MIEAMHSRLIKQILNSTSIRIKITHNGVLVDSHDPP